MLTDPELEDATLVLYTTDAPAQKANAALLVTMYAMIIGKVSPADAFYPISELEFKPFRDAGYGRADYNLNIQDILYGVHRAINEGLLDLTTFNLDEYEKYEQVSNGDWNWITPTLSLLPRLTIAATSKLCVWGVADFRPPTRSVRQPKTSSSDERFDTSKTEASNSSYDSITPFTTVKLS